MSKRLLERNDGRRKGYKPHRSSIASQLDPDVRRKLDAMRGADRPHGKPDNSRPHEAV